LILEPMPWFSAAGDSRAAGRPQCSLSTAVLPAPGIASSAVSNVGSWHRPRGLAFRGTSARAGILLLLVGFDGSRGREGIGPGLEGVGELQRIAAAQGCR